MISIDEFLGKEITEKYLDIMPFLNLMCYRMYIGKESALGLNCRKSIREKILFPLRIVLFFLRSGSCGKECVLLSDNIIFSNRYNEALDVLVSTHRAYGIQRVSTLGFRNSKIPMIRLKKLDIISHRTNHMFLQVWRMLNDTCLSEKTCEGNLKLIHLLDCLQNRYVREREALSSWLLNSNVESYVTANAYSIIELMLIDACRKAQICTKELCHHAYCFYEIDDYNCESFQHNLAKETYIEIPKPRVATDQKLLWNDYDVVYYQKYVSEVAVFGQPVKIMSGGCPELCEQVAKEYQRKYPKVNQVCMFVPAYSVLYGERKECELSDKELETVVNWHISMIIQAYEMASRGGFSLALRYHPSEISKCIQKEKVMLAEDIKVLGTGKEDLYNALMGSRVVLTNRSSTIVLASMCGCKCYNIVFGESRFDFCGMNVDSIKAEDIEKIDLSKLDNGNTACWGFWSADSILER